MTRGTMVRLETDYLVVGAGATGMAFVDTLLDVSDADVIVIDRRYAPGGHWVDAYPFVRLHQPSAWYGVASSPLGRDRIHSDGWDAGLSERASGPEIVAYYDDVMRNRFLASGRVRFLPGHEWVEGGAVRSLLTGEIHEVDVRVKRVDAAHLPSEVPATSPPPFAVDEGAWCVPVGELGRLTRRPDAYVIVGGGKTGVDACLWLLEQGVAPADIRWVRPRDSWFQNRRNLEPSSTGLAAFAAVADQMEIVAGATSVEGCFLTLEERGLVHRIDPAVTPTMMKGATANEGEVAALRAITQVVRLGHIRRLERDRIVFEHGEVPTSPATVHVHCAARGLTMGEPVRVFTDETITPAPTRIGSIPFNAALIAFIESTDRSTDEKNALLPAKHALDTPADWLAITATSMAAEQRWAGEDDVRRFIEGCRLNLMRGLDAHVHEPAFREVVTRYLTYLQPAIDNAGRLAALAA